MKSVLCPAVLVVTILLFGCSTAPESRDEQETRCASDVPMGYWYNGAMGILLVDYAKTGEPVTFGEMLEWIDRDKILRGVSLDPAGHAFIDATLALQMSRVKDIDRDMVLARDQKLIAASAWFDLANSVLDLSDLSDWCRDHLKLGQD